MPPPLKLATYLHLHRTRGPTGVGKHIIHMASCLGERPDVRQQLLAPRDQLVEGGVPPDSELKGAAVATIPWPRRRLESAWALLRRPAIDRWAGDAEWVYSPSEVFIPARRRRVAVTVHCVNWFEPDVPWYHDAGMRRLRLSKRLMWGSIFHRADLILAVSEYLKGKLVELFGVPPQRVAIVGNGVESVYYDLADHPPPHPRPKAPPYALAIGGLTRRKGAAWTLRVAQALREMNSPVQVLVAGHNEPEFARQARELPNVVPLGYVSSSAELPALLRHAAALLMLSRHETFGIPAMEAMAAGTPVVVSNFTGLPDTVGEAGRVVDPQDAGGIARLLSELLKNDSLRADLVAKGRRRAARFTWEACADRLLAAMHRGGA